LPDKAIDLLEALKNLFIVPGASVIFISGIDTFIAKQFIIKRYEGIGSDFAYNYFKKIFNFTIDIPALTKDSFLKLIRQRLNELFDQEENLWVMSNEGKIELENFFSQILVEAGVKSIRQAYNVLHNCFFIFNMNPELQNQYKEYIILNTLKECNSVFFETCCKFANKDPNGRFQVLIDNLHEDKNIFVSILLSSLKKINYDLKNKILLEI